MSSIYSFAFLDSGTGGLPYMNRLKAAAPSFRCVYLAETLHFPYGEKKREEVVEYALAAAGLLVEHFSPSVIVIACNTMSVIALDALRTAYPVSFVGTVPAVKLASFVSKNRRIGILATRRTVEDSYTEKLVRTYASDCAVFRRGDGALVSFVEKNLISAGHEERLEAVRPAVQEFRAAGVDTIVLACTHFVHVKNEIQELAGPEVQVIDSCEGVVRQAFRVLPSSILNSSADSAVHPDKAFYITGAPESSIPYYASLSEHFGFPWRGIL